MSQLRRVASSTSPQSPPISPDPSIEEQDHDMLQEGEKIDEYNRTNQSKSMHVILSPHFNTATCVYYRCKLLYQSLTSDKSNEVCICLSKLEVA